VGNRSFKIGLLAKGALVLAVGVLFAATAVPANAITLRSKTSGSSPSSGAGAAADPTGNYLFTWYDIGAGVGASATTAPYAPINGDNILRIIDPNGCGNDFTSNPNCTTETDQCVLFYVFDDQQEMGECCGCSISPNQLETTSVRSYLVANWSSSYQDNGQGTIVIVGSALNGSSPCNGGKTCNDGCDPTIAASIPSSPGTNLDGSITHDQVIPGTPTVSGLTEIPLFDQGAGDPTNDTYLWKQCASITGNGSSLTGFCSCPPGEN